MEIVIVPPEGALPVERAWAVSMVVKSFKGRRDVEAHLFRSCWEESEEAGYDWKRLLGPATPGNSDLKTESSKAVLLESFTAAERDRIIEFLKEQYADKLCAIHACTLEFPIPRGMTPLSAVAPGKDVGLIHFEKIPSFALDIPLRGLYDLNQHRPLVEVEDPRV